MTDHFCWSEDDELRYLGIRAVGPTLDDRLAFGFLILEGERA
jgi:hypothetical protein